MSQSTSQLLEAIASISTALAFVIALITLLREARHRSTERKRVRADEIRTAIQTLNQEMQTLFGRFRDGSLLIVGAAEISHELRSRLPGDTGPESLRARLRNNNGLLLSASVCGWHRSGLTHQLERSMDHLRRVRVTLRGRLSILGYLVDMVEAMVNDSHSPMIFHRLLNLWPDMDSGEEQSTATVEEAYSGLATSLHGNAGGYFAASYLKPLDAISKFMQLASLSFSGLDDDDLLEAAEAATYDADRQPTRTKSMRMLLNDMGTRFRETDRKQLSALLAEIETMISKDAAESELERIYAGRVVGPA